MREFPGWVWWRPTKTHTSIGTTSTDAGQGGCFCQPQVFFNPPNFESSYNCTAIQALISAELEDTKLQLGQLQVEVSDHGATISSEVEDAKRQLAQLQAEVSDQSTAVFSELEDTKHKLKQLQAEVSDQGATVSSELEDAKHQLQQVFEAVQNLGEILKKYLDNSTLRDCSKAPVSGVYTIQPDSDDPLLIKVYCDMETDGGGWTVFQRRQDGLVDFYRSFSEYSQGFGYLEAEFWLGNQNLHLLTAHNEYELRVDIADFEGNSAYAVYDSFRVGDLADNYTLSVGAYSGTAGDSLSYHNGMPFSTRDRDNDRDRQYSCSEMFHGAWWYYDCYESNLNGKYLYPGEGNGIRGVVWASLKRMYSLKTTEMKIRMKG